MPARTRRVTATWTLKFASFDEDGRVPSTDLLFDPFRHKSKGDPVF